MQYTRIRQHGASNGDSLFLPAGKLYPAFTDNGVVLVLEAFRKLVHVGNAACLHDLVLR